MAQLTGRINRIKPPSLLILSNHFVEVSLAHHIKASLVAAARKKGAQSKPQNFSIPIFQKHLLIFDLSLR
jgi:hypothetical protein